MPRSIQEILDHADELAERIETYEPEAGDERSLEEYQLERAAIARARSERQIADAVIAARSKGLAWQRIGAIPGKPPRLRSNATELSATPPDGAFRTTSEFCPPERSEFRGRWHRVCTFRFEEGRLVQMVSQIAWLDASSDEHRRVREIVQLFPSARPRTSWGAGGSSSP